MNFKNFFSAYHIPSFTELDTFKENMDRMLKRLKDSSPAPGHDRVLYPGLAEYEEERDRRMNGIPLHREVVSWFDEIAYELSIPLLRKK